MTHERPIAGGNAERAYSAFERERDGWTANLIGFAGNPVTNVLPGLTASSIAALKHGHFGPKLHRSDDDGRTWREIAAPAFAADAAGRAVAVPDVDA